jgi:hypothetical protein
MRRPVLKGLSPADAHAGRLGNYGLVFRAAS